MSKKTQSKKIVRVSVDHDRVRTEFPIGTRLSFVQGTQFDAVVTAHAMVDTPQGKALWITITNIATGDWFNADPYYWGLESKVVAD